MYRDIRPSLRWQTLAVRAEAHAVGGELREGGQFLAVEDDSPADLLADGVGEPLSHSARVVLDGGVDEWCRQTMRSRIDPMKKIAAAINAKDGIFAVLGNHDTYLMADLFEDLGITLLANETVTILRGKEKISVTGIDDPHYYYTEHTVNALTESEDGFKIVMAHTPELYDSAAENGYQFYLCGHTHGGQICLPGGNPVTWDAKCPRYMAKGRWEYGGMLGYTSAGAGCSIVSARLNCPPEITLHHLRVA